ncbi:phage baseplate assembly protein V [Thiohalomonas denitrificans]|uniref:phage baseplate assembly protein V n=1 Tax=Thiohalomonas denitrificans TaxID=415747 RepID=UPI0026F19E03|nr:phage baseplate assembly protein V [Thiohalomonas denitrificans]
MNGETWRKLIRPLRRKIKVMITRGVVHLIDTSTLMQTLQVELLRDETVDDVEHFEGYGRTAHAPANGREVLAAAVEANRDHTVAIAVANRQFRVRNLAEGEQVLYDDLGNVIHFKRDRILINSVDHVEVTAPTVEVNATSTHNGNVTINGNLTVNGNTDISGDTTIGGDTDIDGNATVGGTASVAGVATVGGLAVTGAAGGAATVSGSLEVTGGDVTVDGISAKGHVHSNPEGGTTGAPQ